MAARAGLASGRPLRVRYAPSPTGFVHLGGLRTALFNSLLARNRSGTFFIRFEDTDRSRLVPGSEADMLEVLAWAGLRSDETPVRQSERLPLYAEKAALLLEQGHAYRCFCSRERLEGLRGEGMYPRLCRHLASSEVAGRLRDQVPHTLRLAVPDEGGPVVVEDAIRGRVQFDLRQVDDQVLMKSDGFPTYHLASVVDDHVQEVSHVIRGEEWLPSTAKHLLLYKAFGWEAPQFAHLPLLLSDQGGKLSKRHADASVKSFIAAGFQPEALVNFVAFLGWSPAEGTDEVMSMRQLEQAFSLERVHKGGASVSRKKLEFLNSQHIERMLQTEEGQKTLQKRFFPFVSHLTNDEKYALEVLRTIYSRLSPMSEIATKCAYFFREPDWSAPETVEFKAKAWRDPESGEAVAVLRKALEEKVKEWRAQNIADCIAGTLPSVKVSKGELQMAMRYKLTGTRVGAAMPETMQTMGRKTVLERLQ